MSDDERKALDAGCDDYVSKPIDFPTLLDKIDAWAGGSAGAKRACRLTPAAA